MSGDIRQKRERDAEVSRNAILDAAEEIFAENGFDGARIDAIAAASGYNKSLIFHYFDDKLGLYTAVLKRIDQQGNELQAIMLTSLLTDESVTSDACKFRTFVQIVIRWIFDYMVENPRVLRMIIWEAAEGWKTIKKIASQFNTDDVEMFRQLLSKAQEAGLIRPGTDPYLMFLMAITTCMSYPIFTPYLEMAFEDEDLSSPDALVRAREMIVDFVVHGIIVDPE
jgi:TetR/AcrR family transcriptional regulator